MTTCAQKIYITLCAASVLSAASPAALAQQVDYGRSRISFVSRQMNVPVEAKFGKFTAELAFDPAKPQAAKAHIDVDVASFDIGNDEINREVQGKDWFDTKSFPKATFTTSNVRDLGGGRYEASGLLTIKGKTREAIVPFTVKTGAGRNSTFEGAFTIRRLQYGIGERVWKDTELVADEVRVAFSIRTTATPSAPK